MLAQTPLLEEQKAHQALRYYRYLSWGLTSAIYLAHSPRSAFIFSSCVVLALFLAGHLTTALYQSKSISRPNRIGLVLAETFGLVLLLIPTGGRDSPFLWYALNPIFMAGLLLTPSYCWLVFLSFVAAATVSPMLLLHEPLVAVWTGRGWFILVFVLITAAASVFSYLMDSLRQSYADLQLAHTNSQRLLEHTAALYLALESFTGEESPRHLASTLAVYAQKLTYATGGACLLQSNEELIEEYAGSCCGDKHNLSTCLRSLWTDAPEQLSAKTFLWPHQKEKHLSPLLCAPLRSESCLHGLLAVSYSGSTIPAGAKQSLSFLATLGALALDHRQAEDIATRLLVAEEQNRIANEIHDGVSQHLFGISYTLHSLTQQQGSLQDPEIRSQLQLLKKTANKAAQELRASIYRISPGRRGDQIFVSSLSSYLSDLARLNDITVSLEIQGSEAAVSPALRQAIQRIIREATSNAIRHGRCRSIGVTLNMQPGSLELVIIDDGIGFDPQQLQSPGLGLANMRGLLASFGGSFHIRSTLGEGTCVMGRIPALEDEQEVSEDESCCCGRSSLGMAWH